MVLVECEEKREGPDARKRTGIRRDRERRNRRDRERRTRRWMECFYIAVD